MKEVVVTSQKELDAIAVDFDGRIIIKFGTAYNRAEVNRRFKYSVVAMGNSSVVASGNSSVVAMENSSVEAMENSSVVARGNSSVVAMENSSVEAMENSSVEAMENSSVVARGNSSVEAMENSSVVAWGNSSVVAWGNSSVVARGNSSVVAWGNSSVVAWENTQVNDRTIDHDIRIGGNARIVYDPKTAAEYIEMYELEHDKKTVKLFKAVHKRDGKYMADWTNFEYKIGETATADSLTADPREDCGHGIHMAFKEWCVSYGANWPDIAILELEAEIDGLVVPLYGVGKVRALSAKVIREVPLSECGLYGKILDKRWANDV